MKRRFLIIALFLISFVTFTGLAKPTVVKAVAASCPLGSNGPIIFFAGTQILTFDTPIGYIGGLYGGPVTVSFVSSTGAPPHVILTE